MIEKWLTKFFGTQYERNLKIFSPLVDQINQLELKLRSLSDQDLRAKTNIFKEALSKGQSLDILLPETFAVCREASRRVLGMRHFDVQLLGGIVLHRGMIAEMKTGEGKTLAATLPVYLNALTGKGVHVVTVNDYLARRDTEWMGQIYHWLGLSTGTIVHDLSDEDRQKAYAADVTYATNNELGFDYLRDNMKFNLANLAQRPLNFAIVDECDSILIDEARTPLIISGPKQDSTEKYYSVNRIIPKLKKDVHFTMEEKSKTVSLTEKGNGEVEKLLQIKNLYDISHIGLLHHIYQALKAHYLFKKDVDYMVKSGEIVIVDEFTGRLMPGRRWSDGLHQAIEAKEGVKVKKENQTLATVTFQNYFRMYSKLSGMTGTAETEEMEFRKIYELNVVVVPTNEAICRVDHNDVIYKTKAAKFQAIVDEILRVHPRGQPILVGTVSIENSELISSLLKQHKLAHNVLNAKHHAREAEIIAQAGRLGAVTIATNMAGRGTDIVLGGNPEFLSRSELSSNASEEVQKRSEEKFKKICAEEKKAVIKAGGLYIIGTERHESRRIDNQLRGRSGRQGDPGESRFYLSLEDDLMRIFGGQNMQKIMNLLKVPDNEAITAKPVTRSIASAQKRVEGHHFDIRKHLLEYDNVMNQQRTAIYQMRRQIMHEEHWEKLCLDFLSEVTSYFLDRYVGEDLRPAQWQLTQLHQVLCHQFGFALNKKPLSALSHQVSPAETSSKEILNKIVSLVKEAVKQAYDDKKEELKEHFKPIAQIILLQTLDARWKEHLENIDRLKEGINLRAYAQKDPLVEYKKEAYLLFEQVNLQVAIESIEKVFKIQMERNESYEASMDISKNLDYEKPSMDKRALSIQEMQDSAPVVPRGESNFNRAQRRKYQKLKKKKIKI